MDKQQINEYMSRDHLADVRRAAEHLQGILLPTNLIHSSFFSSEYNCDVYIKPENLQRTGSFKLRGAYNKISNLTDEEKARGIIAASAGNHAQGCALSARQSGVKATIVMPNVTPLLKVDATKSYGAEVVIAGDVFDEAYDKAVQLSKENGYTFIHPFDDYDVICGQGTIALEALTELPDADEILVPIGGGGLAAGIAMAAKAIKPDIKVIGIEPQGAMSMKKSLELGHPATLDALKTCAEGVAVRRPGDLTFALCREFLDDTITVSEKDIMEAFLLTLEKHKLVAETSGVIPLAAVKKRAEAGKKIICPISGGNIDMVTISSIINQGMISRGRIMCFSVELPDKPWQLVKVSSLLARHDANVIELQHNQFKAIDRYANKVVLEVTVETNGHQHIQQVLEALEDEGFAVKRIY
ncbi:MAG: threonine ammonia-lyase [Firmicutes bacterium]|nr:threonine ammonia-lyase [Bacillota bacterium]